MRAEEQPETKAAETKAAESKVAKPQGPARVAIINHSMARRFWPTESAIGKRFTLSEKFKLEEAFEVVGVVEDARYFGLARSYREYDLHSRLAARRGWENAVRAHCERSEPDH